MDDFKAMRAVIAAEQLCDDAGEPHTAARKRRPCDEHASIMAYVFETTAVINGSGPWRLTAELYT